MKYAATHSEKQYPVNRKKNWLEHKVLRQRGGGVTRKSNRSKNQDIV